MIRKKPKRNPRILDTAFWTYACIKFIHPVLGRYFYISWQRFCELTKVQNDGAFVILSKKMLIPLFPLQIVVFPGETVALHIFEERYKQLIRDCESDAIEFGIPTYINDQLSYGTSVTLSEVVKRYPNGEFDVRCQGNEIFLIENFMETYTDKLYSGGEVRFLDNVMETDIILQEKVLSRLELLYDELDVEPRPQFSLPLTSYDAAHKVGFSVEQEYDLLKNLNEKSRLKYLSDHLKVTIPVLKEMNRMKQLILMNGHFKNLDPLNLKDIGMS